MSYHPRAGVSEDWSKVLFLRICTAVLLTVVSVQAQIPGYGGPGVATRGTRAGARGAEDVSIRPFVSVSGISDSGLIAVGLDERGNVTNPGALYGVEASVGAYGAKRWSKSRLGLDYRGGYRHYSRATFFDGSDHVLSLDYGRQMTRRVTFSLALLAGSTSRNLGGTFGLLGTLDPALLGTTADDLFDNRAYFAGASGSLQFLVGSKNAFTMGATGMAVRRQSKALVGLNSQQVFGGWQRMVTRKTTIGVRYQYLHVDYPRVFAESDVMSTMLTVHRQIGRRWVMDLSGGVFRIDFAGVRVVEVDPVIAELFGTTSGREAFNTINYTSSIQAAVTRMMRRSMVNIQYRRGVNPGNGVLLLNRQEVGGVNYTYNTGYRWALSGRFMVSKFAGLGTFNNRFYTYGTGFTASRQLTGGMHFTGGVDLRRFGVSTSGFARTGTRLTVGITYSPGDIPVNLF